MWEAQFGDRDGTFFVINIVQDIVYDGSADVLVGGYLVFQCPFLRKNSDCSIKIQRWVVIIGVKAGP